MSTDRLTLKYLYLPKRPYALPAVALPDDDRRAYYCPIPWPVIKVKLVGPSGTDVHMTGLLDTGAQPVVVAKSRMAELGIDPALCTTGGIRLPTEEEVEILIYEPGVEAMIAGTWRLQLKPIRFMAGHEHDEVCLGTAGFFDHFDVTFQRARGTFTLEPVEGVEALPDEWWWTPAGGVADESCGG